jgi:hypothetical protein
MPCRGQAKPFLLTKEIMKHGGIRDSDRDYLCGNVKHFLDWDCPHTGVHSVDDP